MTAKLTIGRLARATGCKIPTIRYYEEIGLLPAPERTSGNTRVYGPDHITRLNFIQHCRDLGFEQSATRQLLELSDHPAQSCTVVSDLARARLAEVNLRIERLNALKGELESMIDKCEGGRVAQCRIIEALADHGRTPA